MPALVKPAAVALALSPRLGRETADAVAADTAALLSGYSSFREELEELDRRLQRTLFRSLYARLGVRMETALDDGTKVRIHMDDLPLLSDDAMFALFDAWPVGSAAYAALRRYGLEAGCTSAMRVLYCKYADRFTPEDLQLMRRIFTESYTPAQRKGWLD